MSNMSIKNHKPTLPSSASTTNNNGGGSCGTKIVFLDCDGVVSPLGGQLFAKKQMDYLKRILSETGAKIVLSSSWRMTDFGRTEVAKQLVNHGMPVFIDSTPYFPGKSRSVEILSWIETHKVKYDIVNFLALDDINLPGVAPDKAFFANHAVVTNPFTGLSDADVQKAVRLLNDANNFVEGSTGAHTTFWGETYRMSVTLAIDPESRELCEGINRIIAADRNRSSGLTVIEDAKGVPNTVLHKVSGKSSLASILIHLRDFHLLLRYNCVCDYVRSIHEHVGCPVYILVHGHLAGTRQQRFWEGVAELCADETLSNILVGFDCVPSISFAAEVVVAQGLKISKPQMESDPIVRMEGRKKCDPTDFHALYLDMLSEIISISDRRAAVLASAFPSMYRLLEAVDSGVLSRLRVEEYGEDRSSSALDPLLRELLSTDYAEVSSDNKTLNELLNESDIYFCLS